MTKKILTSAQGVEVAAILFELNTVPAQVEDLGREAGVVPPDASVERVQEFCLQWYAYTHAALVTGLMVHAPNIVMATYLRNTRFLLKNLHLNDAVCERFIDDYFSPYMELLLHEKQQQCPSHLLRSFLGAPNTASLPQHALAVIAGAMAMTLGVIHDKLDKYDIQAE